MKHSKRLALFEKVKTEYAGFLESVLWRLTGDKELFAEAMQYFEKLYSEKAGAYIYRIALTANSKAWRDRIGKNGQISEAHAGVNSAAQENVVNAELTAVVRRAIAQLSPKQARAMVMRYLEQQRYEDIARNLGCSEAGARSNVSKALAALKEKLASNVKQE
jgi:RNA polymerase sigma factor (sigma-70 family)